MCYQWKPEGEMTLKVKMTFYFVSGQVQYYMATSLGSLWSVLYVL